MNACFSGIGSAGGLNLPGASLDQTAQGALVVAQGAQQNKALAAARRAYDQGNQSDAADAFESLFAGLLAKELRKGLDEGFFGSGPGSDTYSAWLDTFVGESLAKADALGLDSLLEGMRAEQIQKRAPLTPEVGP